MAPLHLPGASYDLFVYDFQYYFSGIVGGSKLWCICLLSLRPPCDFFLWQIGTVLTETLQRSYRNHTVIMQSLCNLHGLRTKIAQCPYDVRAVSLRFSQFLDPNDYLKSWSVLTISVRCPYGDFGIYLWCVYGLAIFQNLSWWGVEQNHRGYNARESVRWSQDFPAVA